jgi:hypothetical protein
MSRKEFSRGAVLARVTAHELSLVEAVPLLDEPSPGEAVAGLLSRGGARGWSMATSADRESRAGRAETEPGEGDTSIRA